MTRRRIIRDAHRPPSWHPEHTPPPQRRVSALGVAVIVMVCASFGFWIGVLLLATHGFHR